MAVKVVSDIPGINIEDLKLKGFKVHELPASIDIPVIRERRDFYKMGLVTGNMTVYYGDKILEINDTVLFFCQPCKVPHSVVRRSKKTTGYACLFTETFITSWERAGILKSSPLFHIGGTPVIPLNNEQAAFMTGIFQKMLAVHSGDYHYKGETDQELRRTDHSRSIEDTTIAKRIAIQKRRYQDHPFIYGPAGKAIPHRADR